MLRRNYVSKALREPLLHFLLIGAAIFAVSSAVEDEAAPVGNNRVLVTAGDIEQLTVLWQKRWQRPPAPEELERLIEDHIREEILYREALALGLDRDDTIVRRHLVEAAIGRQRLVQPVAALTEQVHPNCGQAIRCRQHQPDIQPSRPV